MRGYARNKLESFFVEKSYPEQVLVRRKIDRCLLIQQSAKVPVIIINIIQSICVVSMSEFPFRSFNGTGIFTFPFTVRFT